MIGFYLILIWGIFACQMFFPTIRLIALSFLQEIILIWEIFADIWYFSFYLFLIFLLISLYWALCLLLCFWCTQSMSFGCLPKQRAKSVYRSYFGVSRINPQFSSYICLLGWYVLFTVSANIFLMRILLVSGWTELCGVTVSLVSSVGVFR